MTVLLSQLVMKPVLFTMAVANVVLLGVCAYFLLAPSGDPHPAFLVSHPSSSHDDERAIGAQPTGIEKAGSTEIQGHAATEPQTSPIAVRGHEAPTPSTAGAGDAVSNEDYLNFANRTASSVDTRDAGSEETARRVLPSSQAEERAVSAGTATYSTISQSSNPESPPPAVPLAFSTSSNGASPAQAATLDRLQHEFVNNVGGPNQNPNDPAYAEAWQATQALSDSNYEQQFGVQAFLEKQLEQVQNSK